MKTALTDDDDDDVLELPRAESFQQLRAGARRIKDRLGRYFVLRAATPSNGGQAFRDKAHAQPAPLARTPGQLAQDNAIADLNIVGRAPGRAGLRSAAPGLPMRVGMLSYPMLFQNEGGLQVQVRETIASLRELGIDARLVDTTRDNLADFDIVHIFSVMHGNVKLVEQARAKGCRVVVSGLLNPALVVKEPWRLAAVRTLGALLERVSGYKVHTDLSFLQKALTGADHVIALSNWERGVAGSVFGADPNKVSIIPNGVSGHFFKANAAAFHAEYQVDGPFVFCPGQISPWKNQLSLVKAMAGTGVTVVLAGAVPEQHRAILDACLGVPDAKVVYLGNLDRMSPAFSGAFAAAGAVVLPSQAESGPLVALEALAAGTPAVITRHNGLDMRPDGRILSTVAPFDVQAIREAVLATLAAQIDPASCRAAVAAMSWDRVAGQIADIYSACLERSTHSPVRAAAA